MSAELSRGSRQGGEIGASVSWCRCAREAGAALRGTTRLLAAVGSILHPFNSPNINLPNVAASGRTHATDGNLYGLRMGSILYRITTSGGSHELGAMTSTQNIDVDLMEAADVTLWGDFFQPPGVMFDSTLSGGVLSSITLNAAVVGSQPFGRLQAADRKIYGHVVGCERDVVERNVPWDGWLCRRRRESSTLNW